MQWNAKSCSVMRFAPVYNIYCFTWDYCMYAVIIKADKRYNIYPTLELCKSKHPCPRESVPVFKELCIGFYSVGPRQPPDSPCSLSAAFLPVRRRFSLFWLTLSTIKKVLEMFSKPIDMVIDSVANKGAWTHRQLNQLQTM